MADHRGEPSERAGGDANSISADPLFLDIDGPDNVLGEQGVSTGNGFDDCGAEQRILRPGSQ